MHECQAGREVVCSSRVTAGASCWHHHAIGARHLAVSIQMAREGYPRITRIGANYEGTPPPQATQVWLNRGVIRVDWRNSRITHLRPLLPSRLCGLRGLPTTVPFELCRG